MNKSTVEISMQDENALDCSYAIVSKENKSILIIWKNLECAVFDYDFLKQNAAGYNNAFYHYLLLKHYQKEEQAYTDFLKLIGKMCKKSKDSKYFSNPIEEENRIVFLRFGEEHMITDEEKLLYEARYKAFQQFVAENVDYFTENTGVDGK